MKTNRKSLTSVLLDSYVYITYIVWKCFIIDFLLLQSLHAKQERKARQRLNFLPVSNARTNKCYIFRQCTCIVYIYIYIDDTIVNCISLLATYFKHSSQKMHVVLSVYIVNIFIQICVFSQIRLHKLTTVVLVQSDTWVYWHPVTS